jgi:gluconokinase
VTDDSIANATGLFNMHTLSWDKEAIKVAGITEEKLPRLVPTTEVLQGIDSKVALELGLPSDTPVIIGASDGCLANLGVNAIEKGKIALTIGTSGAIRTVSDRPMTDKEGRTFCYALTEDLWVIGGPVNNGGVVMDWAKNRFVGSEIKEVPEGSYDLMTEQIEEVHPGANDLFFHPYLVGERSPIWRSDAKGSFFGLDIHHENKHMLRAVLEGINLNLYAVYLAIAEVIGADADEILVTGGFTKSNVWLQMIADIFGVDFAVTQVSENACLGAALLGLLALGEIKDFSGLEQMIPIERRVKPAKNRHQFYQSHFEKYQKLSEHYVEMFEILDQ